MIQVYCYDKCTTCKRALKWLDERGVDYSLIDIKGNNPSSEVIRICYEKSGLPLRRFFNTSGMIYRDMGLSEKLPGMSEDEQIELLSTDGMLVKRPLLITDERAIPGFKETEWEEAIG